MNKFIATLAALATCLLCETVAGQPTGDSEASSRYVRDKCEDFGSVRTLAAFSEFHGHWLQVHECLHRAPSDLCRAAEEACTSKGILHPNLKSLAQAIDRLKGHKATCTIEFAARLYRLHQQLALLKTADGETGLAKILRALANRVAARCQSGLAEKLAYVNRAAPDSMKHISFIVGLMGVADDKLISVPVEVGQYTPVLEGEQVLDPRESSLTGGFEFKLAVKVGLDAVRISCGALRMYHLNLLGSLGLLASAGYAAPPDLVKSLQEEAPGDAARIRVWLMSAIICQSLKSVVKVSSMSTEGKLTSRIMVLPMQEYDLSNQEEFEDDFAGLRLPEEPAELKVDQADEALDSFVYDGSQVNLRKVQLIHGPGYAMANALLSYLDLSRPNRVQIPYALLGKPVPESGDDENEDDD